MDPQQTPSPDQPVAYDANGRPLYAAPPSPSVQPPQPSSHVTAAPQSVPGHNFDPRIRAQYANEPRVVHASRELDPKPFEVSGENQRRHNDSRTRYPHLNLSEGEFVILDIKRHPIGLLMPLFAGGVVLVALAVLLIIYPADPSGFGLPSFGLATLIIGLLMMLVGLGTFIAVWVYLQNQFFLTNESVIQEIQHSLFSRREQTVSLGSIEDASFKQSGILQTLLNYGTIRLSTEGEETTYRFAYVANPRKQVATLNNAIESFKNGRPVDDDVN